LRNNFSSGMMISSRESTPGGARILPMAIFTAVQVRPEKPRRLLSTILSNCGLLAVISVSFGANDCPRVSEPARPRSRRLIGATKRPSDIEGGVHLDGRRRHRIEARSEQVPVECGGAANRATLLSCPFLAVLYSATRNALFGPSTISEGLR
jgi:hypothetical protein